MSAARAAWVASQTSSYYVEMSVVSEWFPRSGYHQVTVDNGQITQLRDESGNPVPTDNTTFDIEWQWRAILEAQQEGALKRATFTESGVPVEWYIDRDGWADDAFGGWIRNFQKR